MTDYYQVGETIRITATIVDEAGAAVNPSAVVIYIAKPDGTLAVTAQAMTNDAVGTYHYDYTIGTDTGKYSVEVKATGATSRVTKQPDKFWVEAALS